MNDKLNLIGRKSEVLQIRACLEARRNVLLEGPVGVGKTHLALAVVQDLGRPVFRVDGDGRYTEQKLTGWFDPPAVIKLGYSASSFIEGPLLQAMKTGGVLFINELNRLPEGVQNVLLPAIDERILQIPRLESVVAKDGFLVIATQNPKEFVATSHLSEALLDRFELVTLHYAEADEEIQIVESKLARSALATRVARAAVSLTRMTRNYPRVRRGASVRAAMSVGDITLALMNNGQPHEAAFIQAALLALPTRIEIEEDTDLETSWQAERKELIRGWAQAAWDETVFLQLGQTEKKKKLVT